jgi:hypothetical protein
MAKRKKPASSARPRLAVPPPDNPLLRHEEFDLDRLPRATISEVVTAIATATAPAGVAGGGKAGRPPRGATPARAIARGEVKQIAHHRLEALNQSLAMTGTAEAPAGTAAVAPVSPTAPTPGLTNWVQLGPLAIPNGQTYGGTRVVVTGRVTAIVVDPTNPQTLYVGSAQGGIWKSIDGGAHWQPTSDNEKSLAIGALAIDPSNPQTLYAGTGEGNFSLDSYYGSGILRTTNGGSSWTLLAATTFVGDRFSRLAITPGTPNRLFAAANSGLWRSTDSGVDWTQQTQGLPANTQATDVAIDPSTPDTVYAAFWGQGIYGTTNAGDDNPTWTQLAGGLPSTGLTRIALGVSPSSPQIVYALMANKENPNPKLAYLVDKFYRSTDSGATWTAIPLPGGNIGAQGFYNLHVTVDPATPDIVYLGGVSLWKATRDTQADTWTITDIGGAFHPDNHALAFDPTNHLLLYAGSDGGLYTSPDGGATWSDSINAGLCITQFEFISGHPTSDAVVLGGTQDNGTEQYRNSPIFYHSDDGDGGSTAIDFTSPQNMLSTYYGVSPKRSTQAGDFGTWLDVSPGLDGQALFYPPMTLDQTNSSNAAFGTDQVYFDAAQGTGGWPTVVALPGSTGLVSALHYVSSDLLYAGTTAGEVYRLVRTATGWTATALHAAPLPGNWIWVVAAVPGAPNDVLVVESGFGIAHVWRGTTAGAVTTWTDTTGTAPPTRLPDIPANALAIDPAAVDTWYLGTDIGVFRTTDAGATWTPFSDGLPNCAVFDLQLFAPGRLLRAATHGRGLWQRQLDTPGGSPANLVVRNHPMDSGRASPAPSNIPSAFAEPSRHVALGQPLFWWMSADIKVDALEGPVPEYQLPVADVDCLAFESRLVHRSPRRGQVNRLYVQVHNRGHQAAAHVTVKVLVTDAAAGLPPLPPDFWTSFPGNAASASAWTPVGVARIIPLLSPLEPAILEWDWTTPATAAGHSCILAIVDSPTDPLPAASKILDVNQLVSREKRATLKNLHVVQVAPGTISWTPFRFWGSTDSLQTFRFLPAELGRWQVGLMLPKPAQRKLKLEGMTKKTPTAKMLRALDERLAGMPEKLDRSAVYLVKKPATGGALMDIKLPVEGLQAMLFLGAPTAAPERGPLTLVQESVGQTIGGSTFVLA